jgi:orotate phosphoribosyltransferase
MFLDLLEDLPAKLGKSESTTKFSNQVTERGIRSLYFTNVKVVSLGVRLSALIEQFSHSQIFSCLYTVSPYIPVANIIQLVNFEC